MANDYTQDFIDEVKGAVSGSGSSSGGTIDAQVREDLSNHTSNSDIHVTSEEKASWDGKAELTDIPDKLPADGGNADTVDGKHANEFMQFLGDLTTGSLLDYVLTMTNSGYLLVRSGVTDTPVSGQFFFVDVRRDASGSYAITATRFNAGGVWTNRYNVSMAKWYGWANVADGGNADTVDGKHASDFSQIINLENTSTDTKTAIGIPYKTTTYWCAYWTDYPAALQNGQGIIIAVNYKGSGTTGTDRIWCRQLYISPLKNSKIYQRIICDTDVGEWTNIADGGNAASVGVYTEAKLAELEARVDLLDGDHTLG